MGDHVVGGAPQYLPGNAFRLEVEGIEAGRFTTAGPLKQSAGVIIQREGGSQLPVDISTSTIDTEKVTCSRGHATNSDLWDWWTNVKAGIQDKRLCTLVSMDQAGNDLVKWPLKTCSLVAYEGGAYDGNDNSKNLVESIELMPIDLDRNKVA